MFDLCIETYGAVAHVVDSALPNLYLGANRTRRLNRTPPVTAVPGDDLAMHVRSAADTLAFPHVEAIWLVDVCGLTYDQAAAHSGTSRHAVSTRITQARRQIRERLPVQTGRVVDVARPGHVFWTSEVFDAMARIYAKLDLTPWPDQMA